MHPPLLLIIDAEQVIDAAQQSRPDDITWQGLVYVVNRLT